MQDNHSTELYNRHLLAYAMCRLEWNPPRLSKESGVSTFSVHSALAGTLGTLKVLRKLSDTLNVKWEYITKVDLPKSQFRRAVLSGDSESVR